MLISGSLQCEGRVAQDEARGNDHGNAAFIAPLSMPRDGLCVGHFNTGRRPARFGEQCDVVSCLGEKARSSHLCRLSDAARSWGSMPLTLRPGRR
jgi:hypothetical protein